MTAADNPRSGRKSLPLWLQIVLPICASVVSAVIAVKYSLPAYAPASVVSGEITSDGTLRFRVRGDQSELSRPRIHVRYPDASSIVGGSKTVFVSPLEAGINADGTTTFADDEALRKLCEIVNPCPAIDVITGVTLTVDRHGEEHPHLTELALPHSG
jgi:hypothetical protein